MTWSAFAVRPWRPCSSITYPAHLDKGQRLSAAFRAPSSCCIRKPHRSNGASILHAWRSNASTAQNMLVSARVSGAGQSSKGVEDNVSDRVNALSGGSLPSGSFIDTWVIICRCLERSELHHQNCVWEKGLKCLLACILKIDNAERPRWH